VQRVTPRSQVAGTLLSLALATCIINHAVADSRQPGGVPTASDSIMMTQVGPATDNESVEHSIARFSTDGKAFVVVTHRGDVSSNTNSYSIVLFRNVRADSPRRPTAILTVSTSSSDLPAISNPRWLADNRTLLFLANLSGHAQQIYSIDTITRKVLKVTNHPADIIAFDTTGDMRTVVFLARELESRVALIDEDSRIHGLLIDDQRLIDLLSNQNSKNITAHPLLLFVRRFGVAPDVRLSFPNREEPFPAAGVTLSPNGEFAIIGSFARQYETNRSGSDYCGPTYWDNRYLLANTRSQEVRLLIDAPANFEGSLTWSPDARSVVLGATCLPLDNSGGTERERRRASQWAVEVDARSGETRKIAAGSYRVWFNDEGTGTYFLKRLNYRTGGWFGVDGALTAFQKKERVWVQVNLHAGMKPYSRDIDVYERQDMNTPPQLVAAGLTGGQPVTLMDLNPQFAKLRFGHVEEIVWKDADGNEFKGGLYLPPDFLTGRRYPAVMQAYGWEPYDFWIDGPSTSGFAAQALAGKGIVVVQLPLASPEALDTVDEGPREKTMREALIDELVKRGLVDRNRVGVMGWSRAGYGVRYTLAFSKYPIAAAVVADGMDGGYWQYLAEGNVQPAGGSIYEKQVGAPPFGGGLKAWLKNAASFNLDRIHTPIRQLGFGRYWFYYNWEQFVGLRRLGKPVELIWLPEAAHELVRPIERLAAQQGDVDWFSFWLKGEEDTDPGKGPQYRRWEKLCDVQIASNPGHPTFCVGTKH
jgi:dipeptidyl aminopeptidase/acylaminoacyl peptidase